MSKLRNGGRGMRAVAVAALVAFATSLAAGPASAREKQKVDTCLRVATAEAWKDRPFVVGLEDGRELRLEGWKYVSKPVEGLAYRTGIGDGIAAVESFVPADSVRMLSYVRRSGDPVIAGFAGLFMGALFGAMLGASAKKDQGFEEIDGAAAGFAIGAGVGLITGLVLGRHRTEEKSRDCAGDAAAKAQAATAEAAP